MGKTYRRDADHLTPDDIYSSMSYPRGKPYINTEPEGVIRYDSKGRPDNSLSDQDTAAIKITHGKNVTYKAKCASGRHIFNPFNGQNLRDINRNTKDSQFKFREISKDSFEQYVRYLSTGHQSLFLACERNA